MNILLIDLNHQTMGVHTNTAPLSSGLIKGYLLNKIHYPLNIKISKEIQDAENKTKNWKPDIIGIANYTWNSELNYYFIKQIKTKYPDILTVSGGPDLELTQKERIKYFKEKPLIDICVAFDGEIPMLDIVNKKISGYTNTEIKQEPVQGTYTYNTQTQQIIESKQKIPRLPTLDDFGPIYANGIMDEFLDKGYHPFVQTHRGCPYQCTFCHTSDSYYNKMIFQTPKVFQKDMEYLSKRYAHQKDVTLYIANTNMAGFEEDFQIAQIIKEYKDIYGWPTLFNVNSGKDPNKLLRMLDIISIQPGLALQSLTPEVVKNTKRLNYPFNKYVEFQKEVVKKTGIASVTELILSLPGETKKTFLNTLKQVLNSGVQNIVIYTLMNLRGTPLAQTYTKELYDHKIMHRIVPRQFSTINNTRIFDSEEVIVGTKYMPYKDYLELRGLSLIIGTFYSTELIPLKRFLLEENLDLYQWIKNINKRINKKQGLSEIFKQYMKETETELFETKESIHDYYSQPENYQQLLKGEKGDNLIRKYKCIILSQHYQEFLDIAINSAYALCQNEEQIDAIHDLKQYISTRDMSTILTQTNIQYYEFMLRFNVHKWLTTEQNTKSLLTYNTPTIHKATYPQNIKEKTQKYLKEMNKNKTLSLQILYRDGGIKELWPKITTQK